MDVGVVEELGSDAFLHGTPELPEGASIETGLIIARVDPEPPAGQGEQVHLRIQPGKSICSRRRPDGACPPEPGPGCVSRGCQHSACPALPVEGPPCSRWSEKSLPSLPSAVSRPTYDRSRVRQGIVHLGVGAFHRSHQAMYLDRLLEQGQAQEWGICGVGVLPSDRRMAEVMAAQDGLHARGQARRRHPRGPGRGVDRGVPARAGRPRSSRRWRPSRPGSCR